MMITANNGFIEQSERYAFNNAGESLKKYILLKRGELAYNHGASKLRPYGSCFALTTAENARIPFVYHCFSAENQNAEFMSIELNGAEIENQLRKIVSSGARMDGLLNISFDEYTSVSVLLPGTEEQDRIADFFRHLDNLITLHQRKCDQLGNIKKALLEKMFPSQNEYTPRIRFKCFTDAWEQRKLNEIVSYASSSLSAKDAADDGKWNLYDANHLIGKTNLFFVRDDYITIIKDGAGVGRVRLLPKNSAFIGTMGALLPLNSDLLFDYALLTKADLSRKFSGSTIPHIYFKDYGNETYRTPLLLEQQKIGSLFERLDSLITLHQRK